jgi:hypothetical protein
MSDKGINTINISTTSSEDGKTFTIVMRGFKKIHPTEIIHALRGLVIGMCDKYIDHLEPK